MAGLLENFPYPICDDVGPILRERARHEGRFPWWDHATCDLGGSGNIEKQQQALADAGLRALMAIDDEWRVKMASDTHQPPSSHPIHWLITPHDGFTVLGLLRFRLEHPWTVVSATLLDRAITRWQQTATLIDHAVFAVEERRFQAFHHAFEAGPSRKDETS